MKNARKQNLSLLLFCTPALIVYILFKLYPALSGVFYSLTNWNGLKKTYDFVGLANFREILTDTYFWNAMGFTFRYVIVMVLVSNVIALTLAVAIESRRRAKGFYRTIFYMPNMISTATHAADNLGKRTIFFRPAFAPSKSRTSSRYTVSISPMAETSLSVLWSIIWLPPCDSGIDVVSRVFC